MRRQVAAAARTVGGSNVVQIAARPEPTAIAVPPESPQTSIDQSTTRVPDGAVPADPATAAVTRPTTAYPGVKHAVASRTVQSRSPSAIRSASGPWPETESPTR